MQHPDHDDPWASLADSLGMSGSPEPEAPLPESRQPLPSKEPRKPRPSRSGSSKPPSAWSDLAANLGLEPGAPEPPPARPAPPPRERREDAASDRPAIDHGRSDRGGSERSVGERGGRERDGRERGGRERGDRDRAAADRAGSEDRVGRQPLRSEGFGEGIATGTEDSAGEDRATGEGRGRRRRGRRGGRRRGGRGEGAPDRERRDDDRAGPAAGDAVARDDSQMHDRSPSHDDDIDIVDERALAGGEEGTAGPEGDTRSSDESGEPRRRRRRRGRRGGKRRRGSEESAGEAAAGRSPDDTGDRPAGRTGGRDEHDEEPLPSGYGVVRPPKPAARPSGEAAAGERSDREGESGDRTRRRRRRGGRRRSDRSGEERRSSGSGRRSRGDFAPVAGSFDEDDEGLEFLGLEEAGKPRPRREPAAGEEDVLVESGLSEVLDVPSWVEAIGIVIAGNLDARSRHREDRGR